MKEKIRSSVKTAYSKFGLKAESIEKIVNIVEARLTALGTQEAEMDSALATEILAFEPFVGIIQSEVDSRKANPPAPAPTPSPAPTPNPEPTPAPIVPDEPEWAKKIREKFEAQELKETESQKKATTEAKLKSATSLLEAAGCKSKKVLEVALSKIQVTDEMTDEQIKATVLPLYNTEYKEFYGDGQMPATAAGNVTPEVKKELRDNSNKLVDKALEKAGIKKPESK